MKGVFISDVKTDDIWIVEGDVTPNARIAIGDKFDIPLIVKIHSCII